MMYKLSVEEEQLFWAQIEHDLMQPPFHETPSEWNTKDVEMLQVKMHEKFEELYKIDKKINYLLDIEDFDDSPLLKYQMTSKILSIFRYKTSRKTRAQIKHRFTVYIKNISADEYIKQNNIIRNEDQPTINNDIIRNKGDVLKAFQTFGHDEYWVGREKILSKLIDHVKYKCKMLIILGITGIGKTALAEKLCLELKPWVVINNSNWFQRVNFDHPSKNKDFVEVAAQWLQENGITIIGRKPEQLLSQLVNYLSIHRCIFLIDSLEELLIGNETEASGGFKDEWWEKFFLRVLSTNSFNSRIIITSQELPTKFEHTRYKNFLYRQILYGLSEFEQIVLFEKMGFEMGDNSIDKSKLVRLGKAYKGHPLVLRVILGEIIEDYDKNVQAYWLEVSSEIIKVEKVIKEAETDITKTVGTGDEWKLHKLTRNVNGQVYKERLNAVFRKLYKQSNDAYLLICASSIFRIPVLQEGWFMQLESIVYLIEKEECNQERKDEALEELRKRFLVEISFSKENQRMLGQHNLIRSVTLEQNKNLIVKINQQLREK